MGYTPEWYQENREVVDARNRAWREERGPEAMKAMRARWRAAHEGHTYETPDGYVKYVGFKHPASAPNGLTSYGRIVLWDKLGGKDAPCNWCGMQVSWSIKFPKYGALLADHVNTTKNDNRPENLVPTCHRCNVSRAGGQKRKRAQHGKPCEAVEGCDRPGRTHAKNKTDLWVCTPHYMQDSNGREFTPLRKYFPRSKVTDTEKECLACKQWLPHDDYYIRNGKPKGVCKKCEIRRVQEAKKRRESQGVQCAEEGCERPAQTKGKCSTHYGYDWWVANKKKKSGTDTQEVISKEGEDE